MMHSDSSSGQALIYGFHLDGKGGGTPLGWSGIQVSPAAHGLTWIHLDLAAAETAAFVRERSGLDEDAADVLLAEHTRPRTVQFDDAVVVILRGINFNPGAEPDDMVSVRIWASEHLVVSCRKLPLLAVQDVKHAIERGRGPCTSGELLVAIADRLAERMDDVIEGLEDESDAVEERVEEGQIKQTNAALADLRRTFIGLRRYLTPQRDALLRLATVRPTWLVEDDRNWLREVADQTTRYLEALEAARDRATVTQEELLQRLSEKTEQRMYLLSVVTAVFLPLGFITGILGVNVGGIPGAETPWAFLLLCVLTACLVGLELWYLRRNRWF